MNGIYLMEPSGPILESVPDHLALHVAELPNELTAVLVWVRVGQAVAALGFSADAYAYAQVVRAALLARAEASGWTTLQTMLASKEVV